MFMRRVLIRSYERGILACKREFLRILKPGVHWLPGAAFGTEVDVVSMRNPWFHHQYLDLIVRSGALRGEAEVLDLADHERAVVRIDGRYDTVLGPGLHAVWTAFRTVEVERFDAREVRFTHPDLSAILGAISADEWLKTCEVDPEHQALFAHNGELIDVLGPGRHAFWTGVGRLTFQDVDLRERTLDVAGQEIMTADKVTLRLNAVVVYRVADARQAMTTSDDHQQALYREAQLAIRAALGGTELDRLLAEKDELASNLEKVLVPRARELGLEVRSLGIRDIILPGDMKELMNRVTEARKSAEAALITRREETAAMRSQANTAKLLESSPTLMRLRELEVLEKVAANSNLSVVTSEKGLTDRVMKLL